MSWAPLPADHPAAYVMEARAHEIGAAQARYVLVKNSLGEVMIQTIHPQVVAADAALHARGIDPHGPEKHVGYAQGLSRAETYAIDVARWDGQREHERLQALARAGERSHGRPAAQPPRARPRARSVSEDRPSERTPDQVRGKREGGRAG